MELRMYISRNDESIRLWVQELKRMLVKKKTLTDKYEIENQEDRIIFTEKLIKNLIKQGNKRRKRNTR